MGAIEFDGVAKRYGPVHAVRDLSVKVAEGEFLTILGPSGSGKTTILSLVAGLVPPSAGRILIAGRDVTHLEPQQRRIGLVFQSYALFPHLDVHDNVAFPLVVRGRPKAEIAAKVAAALSRVRLDGLARRRPQQLSGGQQQRVALARAFVFEPDILLLDEPLGALDRKLREEVQVELKSLQRDLGITTLLVTHDQEEALSLSDRIIVLDQGAMQQVGTPDEVYRRPANRFVAGFLGLANLLEGRIEAGAGLRLATGELIRCATGSLAAGAQAAAIVRPERVRLLPESAGEGIAARVRQDVYLGHLRRWHLDAEAGGQELVAAATDGHQSAAIGDRVRVSWAPEDVWLLPEAAAR
ncbi:putative spermidine/putrescine transport system ATP-binding protein [Stella humosa]|uniref:Putative spermidine/putrescine transport system ATP-binding protein n=1 Tax=Stella humosa TaxID=94 RepID=A0A3N1KTP7_9PROT|nr:ABC transporter ATP-binding protein [Stella humosa]ROP83364.1 putative spermidine/putrescine transport system ATP-binding protein [Stella humosa]BBK29852.1 polyamine-transporting ATPase [Stella humosa]